MNLPLTVQYQLKNPTSCGPTFRARLPTQQMSLDSRSLTYHIFFYYPNLEIKSNLSFERNCFAANLGK